MTAPFRQVLIKIHGRCNLACDYCYVYRHADQSWRHRPAAMSREILGRTADRIAEHAERHRLPKLMVVLHGGEPLLAGPELIDYAVSTIRRRTPAETRLSFGLQTNGVLLDEQYLRVFHRLGVRVGVSLDGPQSAHDRHRRHASGRGSHAETARALRILGEPRHRELYAGILCTVDVDNDPVDTFEHLVSFDPPVIDLLLPHGNWDRPPPDHPGNGLPSRYGDWLIAFFDRWYDDPLARTRVRLFESVISLLLGGASGTEAVGLGRIDLVTVETDGAIEQGDALKTAAHGAPATGLSVWTDPFDRALEHPGIMARQAGVAALSETCRRCQLVGICGGGLYAHRYRAANGFANPSVYCADLANVIKHVASRLQRDLRGVPGRARVR